ncbi:MAG TPA: hypothetical protein VMK65_11615 [Longimicrobiales bacterium]|nr:hypothetical protein [Longimicrobiales bacterium]
MKIKLALLADYANVTTDGKLNILGIFDRIHVAKLPAVHPQMQFVIRIEAHPAEAGRNHRLEVRLHDPDGQTVFNIQGDMMVQSRGPGEIIYTNQIITINNLQLPKTGGYTFIVFTDNDLKAEVPLLVERAKEQRGANVEEEAD